ncbi:hypothetical protein PPUJ20066_41940 [Pseudomonas putida]|nr:hypothetical protein PPUJ20066_41940 [Pseudomonas putida]
MRVGGVWFIVYLNNIEDLTRLQVEVAPGGLQDIALCLPGARLAVLDVFEIERRPRGASQHKAAPTPVSGQ